MAYEPYRLQDMGGARAIRILSTLLAELSEIDPSEMTTFELNIIRLCAQNPPGSEFKGVDGKLVG